MAHSSRRPSQQSAPRGQAHQGSQPIAPRGSLRRRASIARRLAARWRSSLVSLAVVAVAILGLVTIVHAVTMGGGAAAPAAAGGSSTSAAGAPAAASVPSKMAPAFTLTSLTGTPFSLASAHGHPVVLYFMATTCGTCVQGSADLARSIQSAHVAGAQAVAIDVNAGDTRSDLASFVQATGVPASAPVIWGVDAQDRIARAYGVQSLETTVVVDAQGHIAYENPGPVAPAQLAQLVRQAA
jgi:cytochrome c biogenesis protein CcmG/thiol:disulfide interchange protein DsbE